jgi:pimeloyl-ACP methyl ester carboxylesterase
VAIEHSRRVRSLTSVMATTGDGTVGQPHPEALHALAGPPVTTRAEVVQRTLDAFRVLGSPRFPLDLHAVADRARRAFDRNFDPAGVARQAAAVVASGDRTESLRGLDVPALVIHGSADRMCDVSGGRATAAAIPRAELRVIDGMGHDLPRALWPELVTRIATVIARGEARRRPGAGSA